MAISFAKKAEAAVGRLIFKLPSKTLLAMSRKPQIVVDGQPLHAEIQFMLSAREMAGQPMKLRMGDLERSRRAMEDDAQLYAKGVGEAAQTRDLSLDTVEGPLAARLYSKPGTEPEAPLLVFFHGGGFALGSIDSHDAPCRLFATEGGMHVLSVEYRRSPEHPFPAAPLDAFAAYRFVRENVSALGLAPRRVAVGGDSAGGNLSAAVTLMARDQGLPQPDLQVLIYPVVELDAETQSKQLFARNFFLEAEDMKWFGDMYCGSVPGAGDDMRCSPAIAQDLSGLAPAEVVTAGFDPLRDEGEAYAKRLESAGVPTNLVREREFIHGFINMTGISPAADAATRRLIARCVDRLR